MANGELIDREREHDRYWRNISELDKIASWILATAWSGGNAQGKKSQVGNVGLRTVAVVSVNQVLIVANNAVSWDDYKLSFNPRQKAQKSTPNYYYALEEFKQGDEVFRPKPVIRDRLAGVNGAYKDVLFPLECDNAFAFHAEMALLQYLHQKNLTPDNNEIGVSKPCCRACANVLKLKKIKFSFRHSDPVGVWVPPEHLC